MLNIHYFTLIENLTMAEIQGSESSQGLFKYNICLFP